jgi:hypothetical protein
VLRLAQHDPHAAAARQQPTPSSVWQALAGTTIGRQVLE